MQETIEIGSPPQDSAEVGTLYALLLQRHDALLRNRLVGGAVSRTLILGVDLLVFFLPPLLVGPSKVNLLTAIFHCFATVLGISLFLEERSIQLRTSALEDAVARVAHGTSRSVHEGREDVFYYVTVESERVVRSHVLMLRLEPHLYWLFSLGLVYLDLVSSRLAH